MQVTAALQQRAMGLFNLINNPGDVAVLLRWNNDDNLSTVFTSAGYGAAPPFPGANPFVRMNVPAYTVAAAAAPHGGHAEEYMIQNWDYLIKNHGCWPRIVDMVITHIPCWSTSSAFKDKSGHVWPEGCSRKLYRLMTEKAPGVQEWNYVFFQGFGNVAAGLAPNTNDNLSSVAKINGHPRAQIFDMTILFP
ncbi:MAG TPA: hypothetical protein VMG35_16810 [Bryobacteraceae bacterium]|nr:hypothetical protein [Bryobacteraceae bacterium]